ncbi:MAG: hypothetical protein JST51_15220 [Armatimonadetes bacterium]|nr:hypothetical protein [Armatimonadota bacterium]
MTTLYAELWNRFSSDHRQNCLTWTHGKEPVLPPSGDGWQSVWTANPDFLNFNGCLLLYYRGNGPMPGREGDHDRIAVAEVSRFDPSRLEIELLNDGVPVVDVGNPDEFDGIDALDPASVVFQGKVFLYYSAIGPGEDSVGLSVSEDGVHFEKFGRVMTGRAPDVLEYQGKLRMVYQRADANGNYQVYLAESEDGYTFTDILDHPVLRPTANSWDCLSIATVRLGMEDGTIYAMYGGSSYLADEPDYFGLARSKDMIDWEFHPGNPVFGCGPKGAPDGGAMWFPALHQSGNSVVMLFEGSPGKYAWDLNSAICMASIDV